MDAAQAGVEEASFAALREQIHETQSELGEKLHTLESEVEGVVRHAADSFRERIDSVRQVVDVPSRVQEHPLAWGVAALGLGIVLGWRVTSSRGEVPAAQDRRPRRSVISRLIIPEISAITPALLWDGMTMVSKFLRRSGEEAR